MRRLTGKTITGEVPMVLVWKRLKEIEDVLGDDYDLERLKQLLTGDTFTEEDMSAAYTSGYSTGMEQGMEKIERNNKAYDLQPVVRCKDCKHAGKGPSVFTPGHINCGLRMRPAPVRPDDFCSYGVRRRTDG